MGLPRVRRSTVLSGLALPWGRVPVWVVKLQWKPQPTPARGPGRRAPSQAYSPPAGPSDGEGTSAPWNWERTPGAQRQRRTGCYSLDDEGSAELLERKALLCGQRSAEMATPPGAHDAHSGSSHGAAVPSVF